MTKSIHNPRSDPIEAGRTPAIEAEPGEPPMLTSPRRAVRNAAGMLAIIAAMFVVFYSVNLQRTPPGVGTAGISPENGSPAAETTGRR
jgi:hypothetical protein